MICATFTRLPAHALDWLLKFSSQQHRLLIYQAAADWLALGPPALQSEVTDRIGGGETPWRD